MGRYILSLGSNVGSRLFSILSACRMLGEAGRVEEVSRVYLTEPVGPPQGWFLNVCLLLETGLDPWGLLELCKGIEAAIGRIPRGRWGPREIDVDIVWFSGGQVEGRSLVVPHPRWRERLFVVAGILDLGFRQLDGVDVSGLSLRLSRQRVIPLPVASAYLKGAL